MTHDYTPLQPRDHREHSSTCFERLWPRVEVQSGAPTQVHEEVSQNPLVLPGTHARGRGVTCAPGTKVASPNVLLLSSLISSLLLRRCRLIMESRCWHLRSRRSPHDATDVGATVRAKTTGILCFLKGSNESYTIAVVLPTFPCSPSSRFCWIMIKYSSDSFVCFLYACRPSWCSGQVRGLEELTHLYPMTHLAFWRRGLDHDYHNAPTLVQNTDLILAPHMRYSSDKKPDASGENRVALFRHAGFQLYHQSIWATRTE